MIFFRVAFGLVLAWHAWRYIRDDLVREVFVEPRYLFAYDHFGWVERLPEAGMLALFYVTGALALCIALGLWYRLSAALFTLVFFYTFLLEQSEYQNHYYLVCLIGLLLIFVPAHGAFSLDARRRPAARRSTAPAWMLWLLRFQIAVPYFFGGIAKLNYDWLHGQPMAWRLSVSTDSPFFGPLFREPWVVYAFSWGGLGFDLFVVPFLLWRKTRLAAYAVAVAFHLSNSLMFQIDFFPPFMIAATTLFFPPDWPRTWVARLRRRGAEVDAGAPRAAALHPSPTSAATPWRRPAQRLLLLGLLVYVGVQLLVPLRHFLQPGNVLWTQEGFRYSWRMKMSVLHTRIRFLATDPERGASREIDPLDYLTPKQRNAMSTKPRMILQFAHHLADELRADGWQAVEVRAEAMSSLNGRKPQWLVDPGFDLASEVRVPRRPAWIQPLEVRLEQRFTPGDFEILRDPAAIRRNGWAAFPLESWVAFGERHGQGNATRLSRRVLSEQVAGRLFTTTTPQEPDGSQGPARRQLVAVPSAPADFPLVSLSRAAKAISIDGRDHATEVEIHRLRDPESKLEGEITVWRSAELDLPHRVLSTGGFDLGLPPDVVRAKVVLRTPDTQWISRLRVDALADSRAVGTRDVPCIRETGTLRVTRRGETAKQRFRRWLSPRVPGHVVRLETSVGDDASLARGSVWSVLDFDTGPPPDVSGRRILE